MFWRRCTGRSDIIAKNGVVASSQPLATQAGLQILQIGGNAVDAAVATAAVLDVVEPYSTGCGGDVFVLIHEPGKNKPTCINGSGRSGSLVNIDELLEKGWKSIPVRGGAPVTVPGAMHAWWYIVKKYGALEFKEVLAPAIKHAHDGFPVSPIIAEIWKSLIPVLRDEDPLRIFSINGRAPERGEMMKNLDLARTFTTVGEEGIDAFHSGDIAEIIAQTVVEHGGFLTVDDLSKHSTEETKPVSTNYRGMDVFEHPPNGQGFAALEMLNLMEELEVCKYGSFDADRYHLMIEAKKLAYADLHQFNGDPDFYNIPLNTLLSKDYAKERARLVNRAKAMNTPGPGLELGEDTVYLATADNEGRAVSFINSLYMGFGSGLVAKGTGIKLQNRGNLFSLDPNHPNCYAPRKRPFHTIIPGAFYVEETFIGVFGIMGGSHQAQAHAQFASNVVDHGMSPQESLEHPRFHHEQDLDTVSLENGISPSIQGELRKRGHVLVHESMSNFGGGQAIFRLGEAWIAGSDPRKDGQAAGF
ncbi:MAG: gamma-glutamyltransferase [Candidatus Hodarchaeales archaeon]|jgi:gamma-glutamyltranspeptidase/glutathione hydrolase